MALKINYNASATLSLGEMNREESLVGKLLSQVSGGEKISTGSVIKKLTANS